MLQIMNAITFNLEDLPEAERAALQAEAMKREIPIQEVVKEALLSKAGRILESASKRRRLVPA
jgi:hypothetical protein